MLSILISLAFSIALVVTCAVTDVRTGTTVFFGIFGFIAAQFLVGFLVRKKTTAVQNELQALLTQGQQRLQRKVQQFQSKPGGNIKLMQRQIEAGQMEIVKGALDFTDRFEPFRKWNLLMGRQIATMRLQFLYQLKEFKQVDEIFAAGGLFRGPMLMDPMPVSMKMARQYKKGDVAGVEKTFKRYVKWFRGDRGTLLYGLMSWVLVKEGEPEKARQLLLKAKDATGNETFSYNWERLSNNKEKSFSNAGLGDEWYGLHLEKPPAPKQQRMRGNAQNARRF
ncbi:hypothetical protein [Pontiella sulfatireligans]|uniref:Uncharacterized protein n=1 Tax=Pontiella sulfatireligans TaxID=2750658 RepID=A0A6C2UKT9_9BACT|nr:hypothetical protein [Pontiella sulfatireligans]VGO20503.1 hypothetical protein SCARR_02566 [Pontiella sulfatireligans]